MTDVYRDDLHKREGLDFTIAVLPDTQYYCSEFPEMLKAQVDWIMSNRERLRIMFVAHLGDVVNDNLPAQWTIARDELSKLKVPHLIVTGNHDYGNAGMCETRMTLLDEFFPPARFQEMHTFGGLFEALKSHNTFHLIEHEGRELVMLGLEFGPRDSVIEWAKEVVLRHQDREVLVFTHAYLYSDGVRYNWKRYGDGQRWNPHAYGLEARGNDVNDGEELWEKLIEKHANIRMVFNGHVLNGGLAYAKERRRGCARSVHQFLVNYQERPRGGDSWLRLVQFHKDRDRILIRDYSPALGRFGYARDITRFGAE